jgi:hypothetical protein
MDPVAASAVRMSSSLAAHAFAAADRLAPGAGHAVAALERSGITPLPARRMGMALGMTLILKALQHGSVGMVEMLSSVTPVMLLPVLVVGVPPPARGGRLDCVRAVDGRGLRADIAAPLRAQRVLSRRAPP